MNFPSGGFTSDDRGPPSPQEAEAAAPDPALLERVFEETLSGAAMSHLDPVEMRALAAVAKAHRGAPLTVDPIAADLVMSILKIRFGHFRVPDSFWHDVSRQIAATLYDAPDTREKLESLWNQLGKFAT